MGNSIFIPKWPINVLSHSNPSWRTGTPIQLSRCSPVRWERAFFDLLSASSRSIAFYNRWWVITQFSSDMGKNVERGQQIQSHRIASNEWQSWCSRAESFCGEHSHHWKHEQPKPAYLSPCLTQQIDKGVTHQKRCKKGSNSCPSPGFSKDQPKDRPYEKGCHRKANPHGKFHIIEKDCP